MVQAPNELWYQSRRGGLEFTKKFYDLGLMDKYIAIQPLLENLDNATYDRLVKAILQHSPPQSKKLYPCQRERKLSPIARKADEENLKERSFDEHLQLAFAS